MRAIYHGGMTVTADPNGQLFSSIDCPRCHQQGPHALFEVLDDRNVFQCSACFTWFTDSSPVAPS